MRGHQIALVSLPFASRLYPSLGLGVLKAALTKAGHSTKAHHFSFEFAARIGAGLYDQFADGWPYRADQVGEWVFNAKLYPEHDHDVEGYIRDILLGESPFFRELRSNRKPIDRGMISDILRVRDAAAPFVEWCALTILASDPMVVGLSSVFQSHVASLSVAKEIKRISPGTHVVLGGSNCEGMMGLETARQFPFLDAVVSGEGDVVLPEIVSRLINGLPLTEMQGVFCPRQVELLASKTDDAQYALVTAPVTDMDSLPFVDHDDYFELVAKTDLPNRETDQVHISFETARGCWWGARQHCTFCGLNGATMTFRSKSPERAISELVHIVSRYPGFPVSVSDNILDYKYLGSFLDRLKELDLGVQLFYEIKANLKKDQIRRLKNAGITRLQPGIESFSTPILKMMRKGITALQNIQTLKWCRELNVRTVWGIICGFPGEPASEYESMADLIPLLTHLDPPMGAGYIRLDRFSPNFMQWQEFGFANVAPHPSYSFVHPVDSSALHNLAYYFGYEYQAPQPVGEYTARLFREVEAWQQLGDSVTLLSLPLDDSRLLICDSRPAAVRPLYVLEGWHRALYEDCEGISSIRQLTERARAFDSSLTETCVRDALEQLQSLGLLVREADSYLGLALSMSEHAPSKIALDMLLRVWEERLACAPNNSRVQVDVFS